MEGNGWGVQWRVREDGGGVRRRVGEYQSQRVKRVDAYESRKAQSSAFSCLLTRLPYTQLLSLVYHTHYFLYHCLWSLSLLSSPHLQEAVH